MIRGAAKRERLEARAAEMRERNKPTSGARNWMWFEAQKRRKDSAEVNKFGARRLRWWRADERDYYFGFYAPNFRRELAAICAMVRRAA